MLLEKTEENLPFYCRTGKKKKKKPKIRTQRLNWKLIVGAILKNSGKWQ